MKIWWNWRHRKRAETRGRRSNWRTKEIHDIGNGKIFFMWESTVRVLRHRTQRMVHKICSSHSNAIQCYHVIYDDRKSVITQQSMGSQREGHDLATEQYNNPDTTGSFFSRGWIELNPAGNQNLWHQCQAWVKLQLALNLSLLYHPLALPSPSSNQ